MYKTLYRKYRPQTFDDVCGQEHITSVLKYQSANGRLSHAYLFTGTRGTGKTTCAKILAKAANCLHPVDGNPCLECENCKDIARDVATDVIEMDAASNNGVDAIRDIREVVDYTPAMMKMRVYIIDEVHMLSSGAFNALLKTLEEPPEHILFILATTEIHKLPATIVSRCQRFDFHRLPAKVIADRLMYIAGCESINITYDAALLLAKLGQGGMRDAISLFELCAGDGDITEERVTKQLGIGDYYAIADTVDAIAKRDCTRIFKAVDRAAASYDLSEFVGELSNFYRDMLVCKSMTPDAAMNYLDLTTAQLDALKKAAAMFDDEKLLWHSRLLYQTLSDMSRLPKMKRTLTELSFIKMTEPRLDDSFESITARLSEVEDKLKLMPSGASAVRAKPVEHTAGRAEKDVPETPLSLNTPDESDVMQILDAVQAVPTQTSTQAVSEPTGASGIECWSEVLERITEKDAGTCGLLDGSKAYLKGKVIEVTTPISFAIIMLNTPKTTSLILDSLRLCGVNIPDGAEIVFKTVAENEDDGSDDIFK